MVEDEKIKQKCKRVSQKYWMSFFILKTDKLLITLYNLITALSVTCELLSCRWVLSCLQSFHRPQGNIWFI